MNRGPKQVPPWWVAATHALTAFFVVPLAVNLGLLYIVFPALLIETESITALIIWVIFSAIAIWYGVIYSTKYLDKAYLIAEPGKVVHTALVFAVIFSIVDWIVGLEEGVGIFYVYGVLINIISLVVFYIASKRYVKANTDIVKPKFSGVLKEDLTGIIFLLAIAIGFIIYILLGLHRLPG